MQIRDSFSFMFWSVMASNVIWCHVTKPYTKSRWRWHNITVANLQQGQMNSKTRSKTDNEDIKKEIKKTAIVKPTIRPKQKSFNGFTHGSARIKKEEESFSSLPSEIQGKNRRVHKNRKCYLVNLSLPFRSPVLCNSDTVTLFELSYPDIYWLGKSEPTSDWWRLTWLQWRLCSQTLEVCQEAWVLCSDMWLNLTMMTSLRNWWPNKILVMMKKVLMKDWK